MSSTQTLIVVALVVFILFVLGLGLFINRKQLREIATIQNTLTKINALQLGQDINRLDQMELAGESLTTLNTWKKQFKTMTQKLIPEITRRTDLASEQVAAYKLWGARKDLKEAQTLLVSVIESSKHTKQVFTQLLEANRENQMQYDSLSATYQGMRKDVLAHSFAYGPAIDQLEEGLSTMGANFSEAKNLSSQGDHVEAKRVLDKLQVDLSQLKAALPEVKHAQHQLEVVFQSQLHEVSDTYKQMRQDKFYIDALDVQLEVKKLYALIEHANELLAGVKIAELKDQNKAIAGKINKIYEVLIREFKAKPFIEKNQAKILTLIARQQSASKKLVEKLKHIDESYELTHGELGQSKKLEREVAAMSHQYTVDTQNIADGKAVFSKLQASWLAMVKRLKEIEAEQEQMAVNVEGLYDSENVARASIANFKQEVALVYRRIERRDLPGSPESFVQIYTLVVNEIAKASHELDQVRINMEKITDELIQISDDVQRLKREADEIINSANLVALTMQYSNKFTGDEFVKRAQQQTMALYRDKFSYKEALDTIAPAIERAEPGSYQRLENAYYTEQKRK